MNGIFTLDLSSNTTVHVGKYSKPMNPMMGMEKDNNDRLIQLVEPPPWNESPVVKTIRPLQGWWSECCRRFLYISFWCVVRGGVAWMSQQVIYSNRLGCNQPISMEYWCYNPLTLAFDPNFLEHPTVSQLQGRSKKPSYQWCCFHSTYRRWYRPSYQVLHFYRGYFSIPYAWGSKTLRLFNFYGFWGFKGRYKQIELTSTTKPFDFLNLTNFYCWWFRNPANQLVGSVSNYLRRVYTLQVVHEFFHQQFLHI